MKIEKVSLWSRKTHSMDLPISNEQLAAWRNGMLIQNAMPHLTAAQCEFLISGCTEEEWEQICEVNEEWEQMCAAAKEGGE